MTDSPTQARIRALHRLNLRLDPDTLRAIDGARLARAGHVSLNTWLTEAVEEKLARDRASTPHRSLRVSRHG